MADATSLALIVGTSTFINVVYDVQHKKKSVPTLVAGGFSFVALSVFGGLTGRYDVAQAFAVLFLLSAILLHGTKINLGVSALSKT